MTALITPNQAREHIDTDLGDASLQRIINAADAEITRRYGEHLTANEVFPLGIGRDQLYSDRRITSITSVTEAWPGTDQEIVLVATDDYVLQGKRTIRRVSGGSPGGIFFAPIVKVVYIPFDDTARRTMVTVELVRLAVNSLGIVSSDLGDAKIVMLNQAREREEIMRPLASSIMGLFA